MSKKRILWVSEFSELNTGFSRIAKYILSYLYNTGKFEIAELASYCDPNKPQVQQQILNVPWKVYPAVPYANDSKGTEEFNSSVFSQFGSAVFEKVCLDFKPDIVVDHRDPWMSSEWFYESPFCKYVKYIYMPTVDGWPQKPEWIDDYRNADILLMHTQFAADLLKNDLGDKKVYSVVRPAVDTDIYVPMNKSALRQKFGIPEDWILIHKNSRNQRRKLFPDLLDSFKLFLDYCIDQGRDDLVQKCYLHLQSSFPDVGWDIGKHLIRTGLSNKVLINYKCRACGHYFVSFFSTELCHCPKCGRNSAHWPNTGYGLSDKELVESYNLCDIAIQYSVCEGLGMTPAEAKSCGLPVLLVDYSAMSEQATCYGCDTIRVQRLFYETVLETEQARALPDNNDLVRKLFKLIKKMENPGEAAKIKESARDNAEKNWSMRQAALIFEKAIEEIEVYSQADTWNNPKPRFRPCNTNIPQFNNNTDFLDWCIDNILGEPHLKSSLWKQKLLTALNVGYIIYPHRGQKRSEFKSEDCLNLIMAKANKINAWEQTRIGLMNKNRSIQIVTL